MAGRRQTNFRVGDFLFQQAPTSSEPPKSEPEAQNGSVTAPEPMISDAPPPVEPPKPKARPRPSPPAAEPVESAGTAPDLVMEER